MRGLCATAKLAAQLPEWVEGHKQRPYRPRRTRSHALQQGRPSITLSARASNGIGGLRPSALVVLRLKATRPLCISLGELLALENPTQSAAAFPDARAADPKITRPAERRTISCRRMAGTFCRPAAIAAVRPKSS